MVALGHAFDTNSVEERGNFDPVPPGTYQVGITKADIVPSSKNPQNQMLKVEFAIKGGEYDSRLLWARMNTHHESTQTREIAWKELGELGRAVGLSTIEDTDQLIGRDLLVEVKVRPGEGQYGPSNDIKKYLPLGGATVAQATAGNAAAAPATAKKPWEQQ